jgi:hypothetical protein
MCSLTRIGGLVGGEADGERQEGDAAAPGQSEGVEVGAGTQRRPAASHDFSTAVGRVLHRLPREQLLWRGAAW